MTDLRSFLVGGLFVAALAVALWLMPDAEAEVTPEPEPLTCEVLAVHPGTDGYEIVTMQCPQGVVQ